MLFVATYEKLTATVDGMLELAITLLHTNNEYHKPMLQDINKVFYFVTVLFVSYVFSKLL